MAGCRPAVTEPLSLKHRLIHALRLAGFLAAAAAGGWGAQRIGTPLPWMIGPLLVTAGLCLSGLLVVKVPDRMRPFGQVVVACQVGLTFTPQTLERLIALAPVILTTAALTLVCILVVAGAVARAGGMTLPQAFLAAVPTSPVEAAAMAAERGVDPVPVIISQTLRLSAVVLVLPLAIYTLDGWPAARISPAAAVPFDPGNILLLLACGLAAMVLFRRIGVPNPNFLGPLTATALLSVTGHGLPPFPALILAAAQIVLGAWLGSTFRREFLRTAGRMALVALASILAEHTVEDVIVEDPPLEEVIAAMSQTATDVTFLILIRAFASGAVALTGTEAIATGVPAFKPQESKNAAQTLMAMAVILAILFKLTVSADRDLLVNLCALLFILPWAVPSIPTILSVRFMLNPEWGVINTTIFRLTGADGPNWLNDPTLALGFAMLVHIWKSLPFWTLILVAGRPLREPVTPRSPWRSRRISAARPGTA